MITNISVENFMSIREKITLSLEATTSKKLLDNVIKIDNKKNLLKSVAIYGANASGKSNILKAIFFMWEMITKSHTYTVDTKINRIPFKLDSDSEKRPSVFEINFIHEGITYKYGFSCTNTKIVDEYLFHSPKGRLALIFRRKNTKNYTFNKDKPKQKSIKKQTLDNTLFLSRATQLGYEQTKKIYEFFLSNVVLNYAPSWSDYTIVKMYETPQLKKQILTILQKADFGGITDIKINKEKRKGTEVKIEKDAVSRRDIENDFYDIKFSHKKIDSSMTSVELNFNEESLGTQRTLSLLGPIIDILEKGKTLFMDELDASLHPEITKLIVKLFNNKKNKNAQLIFTTHNTNMLDNELFRKDQIIIVSKEPNQSTELAYFSDFNLRQETDFERAYLNGRIGGLPFIDETLFD
ncbi:MAG: AAA family ATPase [archaeon]